MADKQRKFTLSILLAIGCCAAMAAQRLSALPAPRQQPAAGIAIRLSVLGFVFDEQAKTLRSLSGGVESSRLSEPWELGSFKQVTVARRNKFALAILEESNQPALVKLETGRSSVHAIADLPPGADSYALSPGGNSAAVYYRDDGSVKLLKGLPDRTVPAGTIFLRPGEQARTFAISDDGSTVLADVEESGRYSIVLMAGNGDSRPIFSTGGGARMTFLNGSRDSVIADHVTGDVYLFRDPWESAELTLLPGIRESIGLPIATGVSYDNKYLFFASAAGMVATLELSTGWISAASCACTPEGLWPLNRNSLFRLNGLSDNPIWIYDASQGNPRTYVLPVYSEGAPSGPDHEQ